MRRFQLLQRVHQPVVGGIGDLRLIGHVVQILVMPQLFAQLLDFALHCRLRSLSHATLWGTCVQIRRTLYRMNVARKPWKRELETLRSWRAAVLYPYRDSCKWKSDRTWNSTSNSSNP